MEDRDKASETVGTIREDQGKDQIVWEDKISRILAKIWLIYPKIKATEWQTFYTIIAITMILIIQINQELIVYTDKILLLDINDTLNLLIINTFNEI